MCQYQKRGKFVRDHFLIGHLPRVSVILGHILQSSWTLFLLVPDPVLVDVYMPPLGASGWKFEVMVPRKAVRVNSRVSMASITMSCAHECILQDDGIRVLPASCLIWVCHPYQIQISLSLGLTWISSVPSSCLLPCQNEYTPLVPCPRPQNQVGDERGK